MAKPCPNGRFHLYRVGTPAEILYCMIAANLPDQLEKIGKYRVFGHRTWTHELLIWLTPLLIALFHAQAVPLVPGMIASPGTAFHEYLIVRTWVFFLPGLLHLAGDVMTPRGIQVAAQKIGMGLFRTGEPGEYMVAGSFVLLAAWYKTGWVFV